MAKILIIEDDPYVMRFYQRLFALNNYQVETAFGGEEGLQKARSTKPDIIILDVIMPKMDGFEVLKALKQDPLTQAIEVLILTNIDDTASVRRASELGANGFLVKSNTPEQVLLSELDKHISARSGS